MESSGRSRSSQAALAVTEDDVRRIVREEIAKNNAQLAKHLYVGIGHFPPPTITEVGSPKQPAFAGHSPEVRV